MSGYWPGTGQPPPDDWPYEAKRVSLSSAVLSEAAGVIERAAPAEQAAAQRRRLAATTMVAEIVLPRLKPHHVAAIVDDLDPATVHNLSVLLARAGWTVVRGRLHPPDHGPGVVET